MAKKKSTFDAFDDQSNDSLDVTAETIVESFGDSPVPNQFPQFKNQAYKIAIIGNYPAKSDAYHRKPFCTLGTPTHPYAGSAYNLLNTRLSSAGIVRDACFLGNVCQHSGHETELNSFNFSHEHAVYGINQLETDLNTFDPNICILLGKQALYLANGEKDVEAWRGSVFICTIPGPFYNRKCITTFHPQECLWEYSNFFLISFDLRRAMVEARTKTHQPPLRDLRTSTNVQEIVSELERIKLTKPTIAIDIEGYVDAMSCISIAERPDTAFIVPIAHKNGATLYDNEDDEVAIWRALASVLEDTSITKVLQNSLYDRFVLQYSYGIVVRGVLEDTMLKHWELYCEFPKSLGFQASIYTNESYYKSDRHTTDINTFYQYCCRDSAVTLEISNKLNKYFTPEQLAHYHFNMVLLNPLLYMENRGIRYNMAEAQACLASVTNHYVILQHELDSLSGKGTPSFSSLPELLSLVQSVMCMKRDITQPKKDYVEIYPRIKQTIASAHTETRRLTPSELTDIAVECDFSLNIRSSSFKSLLYTDLGLPVQYKKDKKTGELRPSTSYASLLKLQKVAPTRVVELALQIGVLRTRSQMLQISADRDKRVRCGYNLVGTETGRLTCYTSPTGSGYNLQTIPSGDNTKPVGHPLREGMRHLFQADEGFYMFQCDLSGADGWTVAAHCASLGDRTLLDDYLTGIKPAKVLCYLLRHGAGSLTGKSRSEIKELTKEVKKDDWDYFACKCGQHGSCYLMGPQSLADLIFTQSEGTILLSVKEVKDLQNLFFLRYKVKLWHTWMERKLKTDPSITASSGYKRKFYGRPNEILGQALAHEPQAVTTFATNLAMYKLWTDRENRQTNPGSTNKVSLRIEPLHQVHDALVGQFRIEDTSWAIDKIKSYFNNEMTIAGIKLVIPFEGNYGKSWGELEQGNI